MSKDLIIYDVRIAWDEGQQGGAQPNVVTLVQPPADMFQVRPGDDLDSLFTSIGRDYTANKIGSLAIYAHGYAEKDVKGGVHGGYGLQLGKQDIVDSDARALFGKLNGLFSSPVGIFLIGCEIAVRSSVRVGAKVSIGDGIGLIQTIADAAGTGVKATRSKQEFEVTPGKGVVGKMVGGVRQSVTFDTATVDPGQIEGSTLTVMPKGKR